MIGMLSMRVIAKETLRLLLPLLEGRQPFSATAVLDGGEPFPMHWHLENFSNAFLTNTVDYLAEQNKPLRDSPLRVPEHTEGAVESWKGATLRVAMTYSPVEPEYRLHFDLNYEPAAALAA